MPATRRTKLSSTMKRHDDNPHIRAERRSSQTLISNALHAANPLISHVSVIKRGEGERRVGCEVCRTLRETVRGARGEWGGSTRARGQGAERAEGRNLLTTGVIYFVEIARYLGWVVSIFQCFIHVSYPDATLYLSSAFHPSLAAGKSLWERSYWWAVSSTTLRKIDNWLRDGGETRRSGRVRKPGDGRMCVIYVIISADRAHIRTEKYPQVRENFIDVTTDNISKLTISRLVGTTAFPTLKN